MKPSSFEYHVPTSVDEAVALLGELAPEAKVIAGGQSLVPMLNMRLAAPAHLIDINPIDALASLRIETDGIHVGAIVRQREVERSPDVARLCPLLPQALAFVSHGAIRNRGTVVGSIAHADSAAELPLVLALLEGYVVVTGPDGSREIAADGLFAGPFETTLHPNELITEAVFPAGEGVLGTAFLEVSRRHGDFAICAAAATVSSRGRARLGFTGVAPTPLVVEVPEGLDQEGVAEAAAGAVADLDPPTDIHASADFRRHLAEVLAARALQAALEQAPGRVR